MTTNANERLEIEMSNKMLTAINEIEYRLDNAKRAFHNSQQWYGEGVEHTPTWQTYAEWIDSAFKDARRIAKELSD
jgi:hypothetical protein